MGQKNDQIQSEYFDRKTASLLQCEKKIIKNMPKKAKKKKLSQ